MLLSVEQDRESGFDRDSEIPTMARFSLSLPESLSQTDRDKSGTSILRLGDSLGSRVRQRMDWLSVLKNSQVRASELL